MPMLGPLSGQFAALQASPGIPVFPPRASTVAEGVDLLHYFLTVLTLFFTFVIFTIIFYFMIRYRRRSEDEQPPATVTHMPLEIAWTVIPTLICVVVFLWSASLYFRNANPPNAASEVIVIGKQWMWHVQHPEGVREINELHVPLGVPIKLTLTSQDVIHDFFIPAFRVKRDATPGRYSSLWFQATKTGTFHFFCAQYCGEGHAAMIGWVHVMTPDDYAAWLAGTSRGETMTQAGERLFHQYGCVTCHIADGTGRGPSLVGQFGKPQKLRDGQSLIVDETFLRRAITQPNSMPIPNYAPVMPTFQGQLNEEQILQLIAYLKSLGEEERKGKGQ
ncbi:MAG TPA: cytochrome c oxidase subunit II [Candidatus Acidoferrales bacterium]|nr:cytochrome c oxidase subunit II [Candidatus Acidoferrales bacterium]